MICILICFKNCFSQGILTKFNLCHVYIFHKKRRVAAVQDFSLHGILFCRSPREYKMIFAKKEQVHIFGKRQFHFPLSTSQIRFYLSVFHIQWVAMKSCPTCCCVAKRKKSRNWRGFQIPGFRLERIVHALQRIMDLF